jgi:hypothetical protein
MLGLLLMRPIYPTLISLEQYSSEDNNNGPSVPELLSPDYGGYPRLRISRSLRHSPTYLGLPSTARGGVFRA